MGRPPLHDDAKLKQDMVDCLWQLGYDAPISAVVQSTGAKAASLYARFGSKKGMLLAALDVYAYEMVRKARPAQQALWYLNGSPEYRADGGYVFH